MASADTHVNPSKLIKDFVSARRQLTQLQHSHANSHIALHTECLRVLNEIFDELRTTYSADTLRRAEFSIIDIEEHLAKIIIIVRFATRKDDASISSVTKLELMNLYEEMAQEAVTRFWSTDNAFIIRPIFA